MYGWFLPFVTHSQSKLKSRQSYEDTQKSEKMFKRKPVSTFLILMTEHSLSQLAMSV